MEKTSSFLDNFTKVLALLLPVSQFFIRYLPAPLAKIFVAPNFFLPISILVLLLCGSIWLVLSLHPYYEIPFNFKKHRLYQEKLRKSKEVAEASQSSELASKAKGVPKETEKPFYVLPDNIQMFALISALLFSLIFISIGIDGNSKGSVLITVLQSVAYIFTICSFFLVLIVYSEGKKNVNNFNSTEAARYQNAISAAIESRAFPSFPIVRYIGMEQVQNPAPGSHSHIVYVAVESGNESAQYRIATNYYGKVIYWVLPESALTGTS